MNLGDLYLEKERFQDAAQTYEAFVEQDPFHPKSPLLQVEVIESYKRGGFPSLVLEGKKSFVERYGMDGQFWVRNPRAENAEVEAHLKTSLNDLAKYYHAEAQRDGKRADYQEAARYYFEKNASELNLAEASLFDGNGRFGRSVQTVVVAPR